MADYLKALGRIAAEKSSAAATGFVRGAKGAFLSEMPGVTSAAGFASSLKRYGNSKEAEVVKEQKVNNVISLEMVRQLRSMNANITNQTRIAAAAERRASAAAAFAEENEREKALRDDKLLKAIEKIGAANDSAFRGGKGGAGKSFLDGLLGEGKDSFLGSLAGGAVGTVLASVARGAITSLLRGGALAGLAVGVFKLVSDYLNEQAVKNGLPRGSLQTLGAGLGAQGPGAFAPNSVSKNVTGGQGQAAALMALSGGSRAPLSVRQNNPGAMRPAGASTGFQSYKTPQEGVSALERQLYLYLTGKSAAAGYKKLDTIAKMISVYAPSTENNTRNYINFVSEKTGIAPDQKLKPGDIPAIAKAITEMEGGKTALQYFYGDNRGSAQRYGGGPGGGGGGGGPTTRGIPGISLAGTSSSTAYQASVRSIDNQLIGSGSGSPQSTYMQGYVSPAERLQLTYLNQILRNTKETAKNTKDANKANGIGPGGTVTAGNQLRPRQDPVSRYYQSRITSLTQQFENTTRRLINTTLTKALFPTGFYGVSRRAAEQPGYLGNLLSGRLGLQQKMSPFFNKLFGKQFGGQYASLFSQAGGLLLDKGVNALGSMLPFQNNAFSFQQIAGNLLTRGKQGKQARRLGLEQLIYGMTGIPLGAQSGLAFLQSQFPSVFGGTGYMTPQQQIASMTNFGMGMLQPGMNFNNMLVGGMNMIPGAASQMTMLNRPTMYDGTRMTMDTAALAKVQAAESAYISETQTQAQKGFFENLGDTFSSGFSGLFKILGFGGGAGGGSFMNFGGGTGGGGFFSNLATTGTNMLAMYGGYKLMQKIGGKNQNPMITMLGTMAISQGLKIGAGMALDAMGYGAAAKTLGLPTSLPSFGGATTSGVTGGGIGSAGAAETGLTSAGGVADSAAAYSASLGEFGVVPGFGATTAGTTAALQAAPGTQAAAAFMEANAAPAAAGGAEFLAAAAEAIPIVAAVYAVYRIINYFAFEKGDTRATYSIYVKGNNDVNAGEIVHAEKTQESHFKLVENFGKAGFVMIKKLESQGARPDFDYLTVQISFNPHRRVEMGFNTGGPGKGDRKKTPINVGPLDLRKPVDATVIKVIMDNMAKLIAERMSKSSAKSQSDLEASLKTITKSEMEGNIEGIDRGVYKDAGGRTSYNEAIAAKAYEITRTEGASGEDPGYTVGTGDMAVFNAKTGQYQTVSMDSGILGYDAAGNPITRASLSAAKAASSASSIASGSTLTYQQQQAANEELKNSNPTTAAQNGGSGGTAVVNSGNVVNNNNTTVVDSSMYDREFRFGSRFSSEMDAIAGGG